MEKKYDYLFRFVTVGNSNVGKSSLLQSFIYGEFNDYKSTTIGVDYYCKTLTIDGKIVNFEIWDTAGQERYRCITSSYYKVGFFNNYVQKADCVVMIYDVTDSGSFRDIDSYWVEDAKSKASSNVELLLIGTKNDSDEKFVSTAEGRRYASQKGMEFAEASAKTSEQVKEAFIQMARKLMRKKEILNSGNEKIVQQNKQEVKVVSSQSQTTKLGANNQENVKQQWGCC